MWHVLGRKKVLRVLGSQGTDCRMILKWILNRVGGHRCCHLDEDRDMVMNLQLIYILNVGNFLTAEELLIFQEGLCCMEFITLFTRPAIQFSLKSVNSNLSIPGPVLQCPFEYYNPTCTYIVHVASHITPPTYIVHVASHTTPPT